MYIFTDEITFTGPDTNFTMSNTDDTLYLQSATRGNAVQVVSTTKPNVSHYSYILWLSVVTLFSSYSNFG